MLTVSNLSISRGPQDLLRDVSFTVNAGSRVALIGANGSGKSTLLEAIQGHHPVRAGSVDWTPAQLTVGYLDQSGNESDEDVFAGPVGALLGVAGHLERQVEKAAARLAETPDDATAATAYSDALDRMTAAGEACSPEALRRWGLAELDPETPVDQLSGGQQLKLGLCLELARAPDFLILDEPTNHLDDAALRVLAHTLVEFRGGVLFVSHDRAFLDKVATEILAVDARHRTVVRYAGNYTAYAEQRAAELERQRSRYQTEQAEIRRMRQDIARTKEQARRVERSTTPSQPNVRRLAKKVARKASARETRLARYETAAERAERPTTNWRMKVEFGAAAGSDRVLVLHDATLGYAPAAPLLEEVSVELGGRERVALLGANGSGKTTLLRTLAGALPPLAGAVRRSPSAQVGYLAQEQELLDPASTAVATIGAAGPAAETEGRSFLHLFLFSGDDALRPIAQLSYGERARLSLALLVARGSTVLLLDEPLNHLDIDSREQFETALDQFAGAVVVVSHDRYFVDRYAATRWQIREEDPGRRRLLIDRHGNS
ncbi:MAG: ABC-F family ATP-binding cassette domain-containing protein [Spirochaetaceae bacterium]|nr:ABC-F family ATP-binding cassette domain-containing protein [Spirochaetaceae bacterium]